MRDLVRWGVRALLGILALGAIWPPLAPLYSRALAGLTDGAFALVRQPFSAQVTSESLQLSWHPLRYTTFGRLQEQMGYVDRFARQGLQGHHLITVDGLLVQSGVLVVLALIWAAGRLSLAQRVQRTALALGVLVVLQALNLILIAHIEFQMRLRLLSSPEGVVALQDPAWYLYYGLRPVPVALTYLLPWLLGGILTGPRRGLGYAAQGA